MICKRPLAVETAPLAIKSNKVIAIKFLQMDLKYKRADNHTKFILLGKKIEMAKGNDSLFLAAFYSSSIALSVTNLVALHVKNVLCICVHLEWINF